MKTINIKNVIFASVGILALAAAGLFTSCCKDDPADLNAKALVKIHVSDFATCLPHQCKAAELRNGGEGILQKMERDLTILLDRSRVLADVDIEDEAKRYAALGVTEDNAYLHVRGHNLYDLLRSMGRQLCSAHQVDFENRVLNASLPETNRYWQLTRVSSDLTQILTATPSGPSR